MTMSNVVETKLEQIAARDAPMVLHTRVVSGTGGGPEKTILNSPRFLASRGYNSICAYMYPPQDSGFDQLRTKANEFDATLLEIEDRGPFDLGVVKRMLRMCRQHQVSIWHGHDYKSNALGLLLRRFWPMKLVTTVHGWGVQFGWQTRLYYAVDRYCLRHYDRVICVSQDLLEQCLRSKVPADRCLLVENAIDTGHYTRTLSITDAKWRINCHPERLLVGAVGRLSDEKDFAGLIRAADRLLRDGIDLELIIVGDGDERQRLESLIEELGRQDRFHLLGYRSDMLELYQAMDVFALSSLREGLPNVLLEAMALEVPVVATRIAGVPRLVQDGRNGLIVSPGDNDELTDALRRLLTDRALLERLAHAGRETIEQAYSFETRMAKICQVYDELLADAGE